MPMKLRLFKSRNFAEAARKAWIGDMELGEAFGQMLRGQADNLGGGVWKKRLNHNRHRPGEGQALLGLSVSVRQTRPEQYQPQRIGWV